MITDFIKTDKFKEVYEWFSILDTPNNERTLEAIRESKGSKSVYDLRLETRISGIGQNLMQLRKANIIKPLPTITKHNYYVINDIVESKISRAVNKFINK